MSVPLAPDRIRKRGVYVVTSLGTLRNSRRLQANPARSSGGTAVGISTVRSPREEL